MAAKKGVPTSGARLQKWLKNPGLRAKLPDSALSKAQLAQRRMNQRDPFDVQAAQQVNAAYRPQEQLLQGELGQSDQQAANVASWFQNYRNDIAASTAAIQQAYQQGQQDLANIRNSLANSATQQGGQDDAQMAADAANRGATVAPSVGQVGQQAAGVRRDLAGSFAALLATQGTAANVAGQDRSRIASGQALDAQLQELQRRRGIQGQQVELSREKGDKKISTAAALRDAAHKSALEDAAFGLNKQSKIDPATGVPWSVEGQRDKSKSDAKRWSQTVNKYGVTNGAWAAWGKSEAGKAKRQKAIDDYNAANHPGKGSKADKPTSGPGSLTSAQESKAVQRVKSAAAAARQGMSVKGANSTQVRAGLANGFQDGTHYTADEINAAFDLLPTSLGGKGGLSPANVKALHRMGIHVNGNFPIAPVKATGGAAVPGGGV